MKLLSAIVMTVGVLALCPPALAAPKSYGSPQDALDELIGAVEAKDRAAILTVFGAEAEDLFSDDEEENQRNRRRFLEMYQAGYRFVPRDEGGVVLELGEDGWPFPIPLARGDAGWAFDIEAGRIEMRDREIGLNEIEIMTVLDAYVDLQAQFRLVDHDGDGVMEFAQSIISSEVRDGLYWPGDDSPIGEAAARASLDGFSDGTDDIKPEPYEGYYFRILTGQGSNAPGGAASYIVNGNMVAGHAALAVPAEYGVTGVKSFLVAENGMILEADLGEETLAKGYEIMLFDPADGWVRAAPPE